MHDRPTPQTSRPTSPCADSVLLVDDHDDALFLLGRPLRKAGIEGPVESATDGDAAIDFLGSRIREGGCLPLFVALDLNMPKLNGFEVLQWIRVQPELENLVVVIISSSDDERDVERAYQLGADCYLVKHPTAGTLSHIYALAMEIRSRRQKRADLCLALARDSVAVPRQEQVG